MNEQNLIPFNQRAESEQRAIRSAGGVASGRARRLKGKHGRELVRALLEMKETDPRIIAELEALGIKAADATNEVAMHARQMEKAKRKADTAAYKAVNQAAGYMDQDDAQGANITITIGSEAAAAGAKWSK